MSGRTKSYGQQCGLAASLDLLGERWTLLILRELSRGPKRFSDLLNGLDGIGTNLLSARLKSLEQRNVVQQVTLPPPAGVAAYELGERGRRLEPILEDLALWGFQLLWDQDQGDLRSKAVWAAMTMKARMDRADSRPPDGLYAFEVGEESFWLRVSDGQSILRDGLSPFDADVKVAIDEEPFFEVATAAVSPLKSKAAIEGDAGRLEALLETFRLPDPPGSPGELRSG